MAKRYGGAFSPEPADTQAPKPNAFRGQPARVGTLRANLLFFAPLPLLLSGLSRVRAGDAAGMISDFGAFAIFILAAWLLREGLHAEAAYNERKVARRPAFPRKIFASLLTGIALAIAASHGGLVFAVALGLVGAALHSFAFGIDPLKNKNTEGFDAFSNERVALAVREGEKRLTTMLEAIKTTGDRELEQRVQQFAATAREMFRTVEQDPRDLGAARKYLGVYLVGARDATIKFADLYARAHTDKTRADYLALLNDLETNFEALRAQLLRDDRTDLDVKIEVLRKRLQLEGVRA